MIEKRWAAVAPVAFTVAGSARGKASVSSTRGFKVKQIVALNHPSLPTLELEVKRVTSKTQLELGPIGKIDDRSDLSAYDTSAFLYANEQLRNSIPQGEIDRATYQEEPAVARRVIGVDELGNPFTTDNPLPVQLSDGSINISTLNAELNVQLSAKDNDPKAGDIHSSVRIGDGTNEVAVNADGSINVNVVNASVPTGNQIIFNSVGAVASGSETDVITMTAPLSGLRVSRIDMSGENIAIFSIKVDGAVKAVRRTWWSNFNVSFTAEPFQNGFFIPSGSTLTVSVIHTRASSAPFEATVFLE
jgi:hypothetical protein